MKRRGISLNELLVAVMLTAIVLPLSGKLFWMLSLGQRNYQRQAEEDRTLLRLVMQLKRDAIEARALAMGEAPSFQLPGDRSIVYQATENAIERRLMQGKTIAHRESYYLGSGAAIRFNVEADASLVKVLIEVPKPGRDEARSLSVVLAAPIAKEARS